MATETIQPEQKTEQPSVNEQSSAEEPTAVESKEIVGTAEQHEEHAEESGAPEPLK